MLDALYKPDVRDRSIFGANYTPPEKFAHGEWVTVARFEKEPGGDGQPVEIDECRMPARFFRLRALDSTNSVGDPKPGFSLSTGSGDEMGRLMARLATEIAAGMVGCGR